MPATETAITFFTASILLALAPGPDNVYQIALNRVAGAVFVALAVKLATAGR